MFESLVLITSCPPNLLGELPGCGLLCVEKSLRFLLVGRRFEKSIYYPACILLTVLFKIKGRPSPSSTITEVFAATGCSAVVLMVTVGPCLTCDPVRMADPPCTDFLMCLSMSEYLT